MTTEQAVAKAGRELDYVFERCSANLAAGYRARGYDETDIVECLVAERRRYEAWRAETLATIRLELGLMIVH